MFLDYIKIICFLTRFFYFIEKTNKSLNKVTIVGLFLMEQLTLFLVEKIKTILFGSYVFKNCGCLICFILHEGLKYKFSKIKLVLALGMFQRVFISFPAFNFKPTSAISSLWQHFCSSQFAFSNTNGEILWIKPKVNS